ncbi:MAG: DUF5698 domain-containing protein [Opitutales bacterium]
MLETLLVGVVIMLARAGDVTIGTLRVISVIDGRMKTAFMLGLVEVTIWLAVITATLSKVEENPWLAVFFALGFSLGNVLGILMERKLPLGNLTVRVVGGDAVREIAKMIWDAGAGATLVKGEGRTGERWMLFSFLPKKHMPKVAAILKPYKDEIFYTFDYGGTANKTLLTADARPRAARGFLKRK